MGLEEWALELAGSPWVYVVMYLFAAIDGFFPPIPSESVVIALATLSVSIGEPNLWLLVPVAALGAFTGDQVAYFVGTRFPVRELRLFRSPQAVGALDWAERMLERRGAAFIIAARYIPVGRVAVNMTAGAVGYRWARFVLFDAIAVVLWATYSTLIGMSAGAWLGDHTFVAIVVGVVGGLVLGVLIDWVLRRVLGRHAVVEPAAEPQDPAGPPQAPAV